MKKAYLSLVAAVVMIAFAPMVKANQIDFAAGNNGVLAYSTGSSTISTSTDPSLLSVTDNGTVYNSGGNSIGTVDFTSGTLSTGDPSAGNATFGTGGSLTIATNGNFSADANDASAFSGSFSGPLTWTCAAFNGSNVCTTAAFSGFVNGSFSSAFVSGLGLNSFTGGTGFLTTGVVSLNGITTNGESTTYFWSMQSLDLSVPEPSTAGLLALGLLVLGAGAMIRKRRSVTA